MLCKVCANDHLLTCGDDASGICFFCQFFLQEKGEKTAAALHEENEKSVAVHEESEKTAAALHDESEKTVVARHDESENKRQRANSGTLLTTRRNRTLTSGRIGLER